LVPLLERDIPDRARLADKGWGIGPFHGELRRKGRREQVGDLRSGRLAKDRHGRSDEFAGGEHGHNGRNEATIHHTHPFVSQTE
jgi:hypothetical protein